MKKWPIALQVYSVRDEAAADFAGTMKKVKAMGYDGVELAGTYGMTAVECKQILDQVGLELVSAHVNIDLLEDDAILDDYAATGIKFVAIPWLVGPKDAQELEAVIARIDKIGERVQAKGMQLLYHNHDFEFEKINGEYILDTYYSRIPAEHLQTELDTCWVNVGGEEPAGFVRKYTGKAPVVHLKDFAGSKSENMYALIGTDSAKEDSAGKFEFRPVGYGRQDIPAILQAAEDAGAGWVVVEQDSPSMGKTPMESVQMSIEYLKGIL
jgi:sugar phosphate isomerase/epimerase